MRWAITHEVFLLSCTLLCLIVSSGEAASMRICVSALPLMGHINPLKGYTKILHLMNSPNSNDRAPWKGIIAELLSRDISVTVAAFSSVAVHDGFKPVAEA